LVDVVPGGFPKELVRDVQAGGLKVGKQIIAQIGKRYNEQD
jgi:hypothetical protein